MSDQVNAELQTATEQVLAWLDEQDFAALGKGMTDDAQGIDEISGGWRRGRAAMDAYFAAMQGSISDIHSRVLDPHVVSWTDTGLVTFVLEQSYTLNGANQTLAAPTTLVFRRESGEWRLALVHSAPAPE